MSYYKRIFAELNQLQRELQMSASRLWSIRLTLSSSNQKGYHEADFLPRRLDKLTREEQRKYDNLLAQLGQVISTHLDGAFIAFSSVEDVETMLHIRRTIRYIRNAYSDSSSVGYALTRLSLALPGSLPVSSNN